MFDSKRTNLFEDKKTVKKNSFVNAGLEKSAETRSGNNAIKYTTTGNVLVDQFAIMGSYKKPRPFSEIWFEL